MILSNLVLFNGLLKNCTEHNKYLISITHQKQQEYFNIRKLVNLKHKKSSLIIVSNSNNLINKSTRDLIKIKNYNNFISRNLWQKLINKYLQETIFISASNHLSDKYINKVKAHGLSVYRASDYKKFLLKFSQDLLNGKILVSMKNKNNTNIDLLIDKHSKYVKYKWTKLLSFDLFKANKAIFPKQISINNKKINYETLPLFTLINKNYQVLMSESSNKLFRSKSCFDLILKFFNSFLLKSTNDQKVYTGLLFVNPEDALEYRQYIQCKYIKSTRINSIQSVISSMNLYYNFLNSSIKNSEFRLIPDLKEVSDLIYKYRRYKHLSFDFKQKHGSNYFQGQPIYLIKPINVKNKNNNRKKSLDYSYFFNQKNTGIKYEPIFLNYQTAINAWNKFRQEYSYYDLPFQPELYVSNLEIFIKTSYYNNTNHQIIFIPSFNTYKFIKNFKQSKINNYRNIKQTVFHKSLYIKTLLSRLIWSLTSRQPVNW
uniref:Ycf80 n=1 Tax=Bostrychia simpliciuscula TaxID=324754 RepID=A0A1Z1M7V5_9FLOR|nr:hypothetical protein [Bostrychia simpliciuscula]ARW62049.1 hypothetical protein [Bostrychia simpliciuscula]